MTSVRPRSISEVKTNLLNPALTSHFQVTIGRPFNDAGFNTYLSDTGCNWKQDQLNLMCCKLNIYKNKESTTIKIYIEKYLDIMWVLLGR